MPFLGIINNIFKIRIDYYKYINSQRPSPKSSDGNHGIGEWKNVMSILNTISIFSNIGLITFRTHLI